MSQVEVTRFEPDDKANTVTVHGKVDGKPVKVVYVAEALRDLTDRSDRECDRALRRALEAHAADAA